MPVINRPSIQESVPGEFLDWEVTALDLFDAVAGMARLRKETSHLRQSRGGAVTREVDRRYWPVPYPPTSGLPDSMASIRLWAVTKTIREPGMLTVVSRTSSIRIREPEQDSPDLLVRPELVCVQFADGDQSPWGFAANMAGLGGDFPYVGQQEHYIMTLQRALGALAGAQ